MNIQKIMQKVKNRINSKLTFLSLKEKERRSFFYPYPDYTFDDEECIKRKSKIYLNYGCFDTCLEIIFEIIIILNLFFLSTESFFDEKISFYEELSVKILNVIFFLFEIFRNKWTIICLKINFSNFNEQGNKEKAFELLKNILFDVISFFSLFIAFFFEKQFFLRFALYCFRLRKWISLAGEKIKKTLTFLNLSTLMEEYTFLIIKIIIFLHLWTCFCYILLKNNYFKEDLLSLLSKYSFSLYQCLSFEEYKAPELNYDFEYLFKICIFKTTKLIFFSFTISEFMKISLNFSKEKMKIKYIN